MQSHQDKKRGQEAIVPARANTFTSDMTYINRFARILALRYQAVIEVNHYARRTERGLYRRHINVGRCALFVQRVRRDYARRLAGLYRRGYHAQHVPRIAARACRASRRDKVGILAAHKAAQRDLEQLVAPVEVAYRAHGIVKVAVCILHPERVITVDVARRAELRHTGQLHHVALEARFAA